MVPLVSHVENKIQSHTVHSSNPQMYKESKYRIKKQLLRESIGEFFYNLGAGKGFLTSTQNLDAMKEKNDKFDYIKLIIFCMAKTS